MAFETKKSLFKRPLFARPTKPAGDTTDLFSRSNASYLAVAKEEERKLEKKAARAARKNQELVQQGLATIGQKRQRSPSTSGSASENESETEQKASQEIISDPKPIEENDEDLVITSVTARTEAVSQIPREPVVDESDVESDEELAELARQARDAAKKKLNGGVRDAEHSFEGDISFRETYTPEMQSGPRPNVIVAVSSALPGAETKRFKRPLEKRLREVRLRWCVANDFAQEEAQNIVLMFRGKRVFDLNTLAGLGVSVDEEGNAKVEGNDDGDLLDDDGCIIMEAVHEKDPDTYTVDHQGAKAHSPRDDDDALANKPDLPEPPTPAQEQSIKIICRAKGLKDFKVLVKNSSTVARLQWAFIMNHRLPQDSEINVILDGDILAPETTMTDLDVEDMDVFDVQVKTAETLQIME